MTAQPAALTLRGVRIRHEGAPAWTPDGVTLEVAAGEVLLVLGPSGCGKSTLTLALNGLVPHAVPADLEGTVLVAGRDTAQARVAELSEQVGMVFQDPDAQLVSATVLDEVCFGPENQLVTVDDVLERAEWSLRAVGLWERRDDNPDTLSGGGKQRLAIACALALDAPVLVLDEPTANLDPAGIEEVYEVLRSLRNAAEPRSIVLVEHNLDAAMDLVDTVAVLDAAGRLVAHGPVGEVLRDRADELLKLGVWLPTATLAALRLRSAGVTIDPLPLTTADLSAALDALPSLPTLPTQTLARAGDATSPEWAVRIRGLTVRRGRGDARREVLHSVSLDVRRGDFVAVLGANGTGKTTLVQALAGVVRPPRGTVDLDGLDPARASVAALTAAVGFVFQNPEHQFVTASVTDELAYGLRLHRRPEAEVRERVDRMLATLGLQNHRDAHPFLLSGGQKRRLSVGTALIAGAPLLVLDEPTFGQDRERAAELLGLLGELNAAGTTVIIVTHDLQLVAEHANHVVVLTDGGVVASGRTAAVLADRATLERAGLRPPPLARAFADLTAHPSWRSVTRLADLPSGPDLPSAPAPSIRDVRTGQAAAGTIDGGTP
ncbi:ABC transporter ATP-binding protein [Leifsonia poae]|uniref:ABC transporter ATP-binding protein n=1 Tax=Leifsonia poae TaxID=110933 RepID=UPI001CBE5FE5|nr:ABC transporter ATP-binding protein [Leifsonia poae]